MNRFNLHKYSLNTEFLMSSDDPSGSFGAFTSNYSKEKKQQIRNQLGLKPEPNMGIKYFFEIGEEEIQETLALYYIGPYVRNKTNIQIPEPLQPLSLSSLFLNQINPVTKIKGMILSDLYYHITNHSVVDNIIRKIVSKLKKILKDILVHHEDLNIYNIMTTMYEGDLENYIHSINETHDSLDITIIADELEDIIMENIAIVDCGFMWCDPMSEPGKKILKLRNKIQESMPENYYAQVIRDAASQCVFGFEHRKGGSES